MIKWLVLAVDEDVPHRFYPPDDSEVSFGPQRAEQETNTVSDHHPPMYHLIGYDIPAETPEEAVSESMRRVSLHVRERNCPQEWLTRFQKAREADMFTVRIIGTDEDKLPENSWTVFQGSDGFAAWDDVSIMEVLRSEQDELEELIAETNEKSTLPDDSLPEFRG